MLTRWAKDRGLKWMVEQVLADTGLTVVATTDAATSPRWLLTLYDLLRAEPLVCTWCGTGDELLYFGGPTIEQVIAICDRCHLRPLPSGEEPHRHRVRPLRVQEGSQVLFHR